jgi:hypothetical protein
VGESSRNETAITVTGLKPGHFYNVRVIAVGSNNFQAGSRVIRLRTYNRDGRPGLGNGRVLSNLATDDVASGTIVDSSDESAGVRSLGIGLESAAAPEAAVMRDPSSLHLGQRRNTGGRKHSPSTASERPTSRHNSVSKGPDESMQQLTERFESIRGETEEVISQMARDAEEFKTQMADLLRERDEKRQLLKEKEDASEKLKKEVHSSERANRQAQNRKTQKDKALREKQAERAKMDEDKKKWQKEVLEMQTEKELWQKEREKIAIKTKNEADEMKAVLRKRQNSLNAMEEAIRMKGLQIKELEEERKTLPGGEGDEESKELDAAERLRDIEWDRKERDLMTRYNTQRIIFQNLESDLAKAQAFYAQIASRQITHPLIFTGISTGVDFDSSGQARPKARRQLKSRTNTISSPIAAHPIIDSVFPSASVYNNMAAVNSSPNFAPGPYFDMSANHGISSPMSDSGITEADIKALTAGAPLSPTATSLLPSNIFADDEPPSPRFQSMRNFGAPMFSSLGPAMFEREPPSPQSSSRSASLISSPQTSANNLNLYQPSRDHDIVSLSRHSTGQDFGVIGSGNTAAQPPTKRFQDLFSLSRQRGKTMGDGPALGTLKAGQSQSFPRVDESETLNARNRRTSFTNGWGGIPFLNRGNSDMTEGNGPAPARNMPRRRRAFGMFGSSIDDPTALHPDRDPSSPRPASIASSDLPRPSTDSAPFGWPAADSGMVNRNSPLATNWSVTVTHPWSRNPSRRPSLQHGSSTHLPTTGIASDDDDFLPPDTASQTASPPPVGVIGSRPISQMSATPKLNPTAPTFKAMFGLANKGERPDKSEKKGKSKDRKDPENTFDPTADDMSPSTSRMSRDQHSIVSQNSITESYDSLDRATSNTTGTGSDMNMALPYGTLSKDSKGQEKGENSFQKLLRKGSSSKFSIGSFRGKEMFGKKEKDNRNASGDRASSFGDVDESGEELAGGGSGLGNVVVITGGKDSVTSSPAVGSVGTPKEGRMSVNWGRFSIKKGKGRSSTDVERAELSLGLGLGKEGEIDDEEKERDKQEAS